MKHLLTSMIIATTVALTGCFESDEQAAIRVAAQEEIYTGYEVKSIEITAEESEMARGGTVTKRNFVAEVDYYDDVVDGEFADSDKRFVVVKAIESEEPFKVAGVYYHWTDGVDTKEEVDFSRNADLYHGYDRISELETKYKEVVFTGSDRVNELLAAMDAEATQAQGELESLKKDMAKMDKELQEARYWIRSKEADALRATYQEEQAKLKKLNDEIMAGVNKEFNAELQPHEAKRDKELQGTRNMGWSERSTARREINQRYRDIKQELNDKWLAVYEEKKLKTTPEMTAAEKAFNEARDKAEATEKKTAEALSEARTKVYNLESKLDRAKHFAQRFGKEESSKG